ncbi:hypothetical protein OG21DRAFT_1256709 [Imleria badia]|nr:hypothetical protein OG21DRAFT_1256709 [Imleria badia]
MATDSDVPPGLGDVKAHVFAQGGNEHEWQPFKYTRLYTNAFIIDSEGNKLLLGFKKRGFGTTDSEGKSSQARRPHKPPDESSRCVPPRPTSAPPDRRPCAQEEAGIDAPLEYVGTLFFIVTGVDKAFDIRVYTAREYVGVPTESDEMKPWWFSLSDDSLYARRLEPSGSDAPGTDLPHIPYDQMWADDIHWLPHLVRGERFVGRADLDEGNTMKRYWFGSVSQGADAGDQM